MDPDQAEHTGTHDHDNRRYGCLTQPSGSGQCTVHKGRDPITQAHNRQTVHSGFNHRNIIGKDPQERSAAKYQQQPQYQGESHGIKRTDK